MSFHSVRSLGNGITEINASTDTTVNATIFVKRDSIAAVEHRKRFREIRVDIVGKEGSITLRYMLDAEGEEMVRGLLDCMKDVPEALEKEFAQIKVKELAAREKIDTMRVQMTELRGLLEQIIVNTQAPVEGVRDAEETDSAMGPTDLSAYETLSECEDKKEGELANFGDAVILVILLALSCVFLTSAYINASRFGLA
jgi:hypothetical protein